MPDSDLGMRDMLIRSHLEVMRILFEIVLENEHYSNASAFYHGVCVNS